MRRRRARTAPSWGSTTALNHSNRTRSSLIPPPGARHDIHVTVGARLGDDVQPHAAAHAF